MKRQFSILVSIVILATPVLTCSKARTHQSLSWYIVLEVDPSTQNLPSATKQAVTTLEGRLNAFGVANFQVKELGNGRILVKLPDVANRERLKSLLSDQGRLEISHLISPPSPAPSNLYETKEAALAAIGGHTDRRVVQSAENASTYSNVKSKPGPFWGVVESPPLVAGSDLRSAAAIEMPAPLSYRISFTLRPEAAERFSSWTSSHLREYVAVIYNDEIKSIAFIKSQISDQGEISGRFSKESAEDIALVLRMGALPKIKIVEEGQTNFA
jgi:preprotein translocase subunit SecD